MSEGFWFAMKVHMGPELLNDDRKGEKGEKILHINGHPSQYFIL